MLRDEDGMATHRRLLAVVARIGGCKSLSDERRRVIENRLTALAIKVGAVLGAELETAAKW